MCERESKAREESAACVDRESRAREENAAACTSPVLAYAAVQDGDCRHCRDQSAVTTLQCTAVTSHAVYNW